ncbi:MAG: hypothetical protein SOX26_03270 [Phocaeicola sp.]|nr:hypothetical protein [Phocaeicola sp.]
MHSIEKNTGKSIEKKITTVTFILGLLVLNIIWAASSLADRQNNEMNITRGKVNIQQKETPVMNVEELLSHKIR